MIKGPLLWIINSINTPLAGVEIIGLYNFKF